MKKMMSYLFLGLSVVGLNLSAPQQAEARPRHHAAVVVTPPRVVAPRVVVTVPPPAVVAPRVVVARPPYRTYAQVYRVGYGVPHQVWVDGYYDMYGRWIPGYWTWTY